MTSTPTLGSQRPTTKTKTGGHRRLELLFELLTSHDLRSLCHLSQKLLETSEETDQTAFVHSSVENLPNLGKGCTVAPLVDDLHELPACSPRRSLIALLLEDETTEGSRALFGGKLVEEAVEEQLTEHQFITGTNLTGDASLELHHVCFVDEAQAAKNSSSVLELLHLQNRHGITDLLSDLLDLVAKLNLVLVLGVESCQSRRVV
ncbi:hypothetical protein KCV06_g240, partial [Aureobasidium melanogenum]